jgi:hypothetical protein
MPDFPSHQLPNQLTVHGFGQDGNGDLYAMVTNSENHLDDGGIVYKFVAVPEPSTMTVGLMAVLFGSAALRRRRLLE